MADRGRRTAPPPGRLSLGRRAVRARPHRRRADRRTALCARHRVPPRAHLLPEAGPGAGGMARRRCPAAGIDRSAGGRREGVRCGVSARRHCAWRTPRSRTSTCSPTRLAPCRKHLFDTQLAAGFVGYGTPSLVSLLQGELGVTPAKGDRLTDWLRRPLTDAQKQYAAIDVGVSPRGARPPGRPAGRSRPDRMGARCGARSCVRGRSAAPSPSMRG